MSKIKNSQSRASYKYVTKAYDRINMYVYKGKREEIARHAEAHGETVNQFLIRAIQETVTRDGGSIDMFEKPDVKNPPKNDETADKLLEFCKEKRTRKEIKEFLGFKSVDYAMKFVSPLVESGKIEVTSMKVRNYIQKYYQTVSDAE